MSNSSDFLQEYLNNLLNDVPLDAAPFSETRIHENKLDGDRGAQPRADDATLKLAAGGNIASLSSVARPARSGPARPYAEPIRTLNLRMPLPPVAEVPAPAPAVEAKQVVETEVKPEAEAKPAVAIKALAETPVEPQPPEPVSPAAAGTDLATMSPPAAWLSNGRPQWAQQPFECLLFKAGGLQLAAPLVELGSIYPLEKDALTEIFGQTQWFMGLLPVKEYNIRAMDTSLVVMPERYSPAMREQYRYVVSLFGSDWGLAVDAVMGTTLLDPDRVRWRSERSKRPWLAGTLIDQMCALFDIAQLAWLFHAQDRKRAPR